jgi:hypothetical protein
MVLVNADRTRTAWTPANKDVIIVAVEREPLKSACSFSRDNGLSQQQEEEEEEKLEV